MTTARLAQPPGLGDLLQALRSAGLPVGAREVLRLHRAFTLEPTFDQQRPVADQLRRLLTAALVHSPAENEIFEPVFRAWRERCAHWERRPPTVDLEQDRLRAPPETGERGWQRWRLQSLRGPRGRFLVAVLAAITIGVALAIGVAIWLGPPKPEPPSAETVPGPVIPGPDLPPASFRPDDSAVPTPQPAERPAGRSLAFALPIGGAMALTAAGLLLVMYRRRQRSPPSRDMPRLPGPRRAAYLPLASRGPELLASAAAQTMVWGVDRHRTENPTTELDLEQTAAATARGAGIPELCFVPEQRLREVWLWLDGQLGHPSAEQYAEEIAGTLAAAGLPVRIAGFDGYPLELAWDEGQRFRPQELESHRQTALVAVMTAGTVLLEHCRDNRRGPATKLLHSLAAWERLVFVDFSRGPELARLLARNGLTSVSPEALPYAFGMRQAPPQAARQGAHATHRAHSTADGGEARAWAAALALSPRPPTRAEAFALRREAGIGASAWQLDELERAREKNLRWLRDTTDGLAAGARLDRFLGFWERRLDEEARRRREAGAIEAWEDRPARRFLEMERALLKLRRGPGAAAEAATELTALAAADEALAAELRRRLAVHEARGASPERPLVPLPWHLGQLDAATRQCLGALGLEIGRGQARAPARLGLAAGLLLGLGLLWLGQGFRAWLQPEPPAAAPGPPCPPEVWVHTSAANMRFVRVCAGSYPMGSNDGDSDEKPAHEVELGEYWIGEREVSNTEFRLWRPDHAPDAAGDLPAVEITWEEASTFCQWLGRSEKEGRYDLPSEAQWEAAARGPGGRSYPWGDDPPSDQLAVFGRDFDASPEPVGSYPEGAGPFGTLHQAGNVWEWVRDCYDPEAYGGRTGLNPVMIEKERCQTVGELYNSINQPVPGGWSRSSALRVVRGGSFRRGPRWLRSAGRDGNVPVSRLVNLGFRCVRSSRPQP